MSLSRKHFNSLAAIIRETSMVHCLDSDSELWAEFIAKKLADWCESHNPRFDRYRFLEAYKPECNR